MKIDPKDALQSCETLLLDMDGTLLDLAFDNYVWNELVPAEYAKRRGMNRDDAMAHVYAEFRRVQGQLDWYCLDYWSERLGLDILEIHHDVAERIGYLPGARQFLETVSKRDIRLLLVTNSHGDTLTVKTRATEIVDFFDRVYTSHDIGAAKEDQSFWHAVQEEETLDPASTLFIDDNVEVLRSARRFGVEQLLSVTRPDTSAPPKDSGEFAGVEAVADLLR